MDFSKEKLLNDTYNKFMEVVLSDSLPLETVDELFAEDVMGFGTTVDEKIFFTSGVRELLSRQREQSRGLQMKWIITPVVHRKSADENFAIFSDDIQISLAVNNETIEMYVRISTVFEFQRDKWLVVHWHGSKPENVESETDTFGIEDWKQKNAALEKIVAERTLQLIRQKEELENTLNELRDTQKQLIQSEKMASLGELTAGIAHEIQNPLNFVNNFSEVSGELVAEMNVELEKGNTEDAKLIAADLKQNLEKINHHGKRADAIVKGMLQHSRAGSGQKELTDINVLADEYLRLAYHGLRAKDKSFNASFETNLDSSLPKINVVPQDLGRVILNLINNAFYAVNEKAKQNIAGYEPTVIVSTHRPPLLGRGAGGEILIKVQDNGNGIPDSIKEKIFQPFFTTKPTGQGTGLGLSLSYDIVKAHGGEIKIESKEGTGSEFIILLPLI